MLLIYRTMELINHAFGTCDSHVQPKVFHFENLSFWWNNSKLQGQQNSVWCKILKLETNLHPTSLFMFILYLLLLLSYI
jgi:hypothetical protein